MPANSLTNWPLVSIILPVYNEARFIEETLQAVFDQDYPPEKLEVIVVDGGSTDGTSDLIRQFFARHPRVSTHLLDNPRQIVAPGLNIALRQAQGEIIIRVDGHSQIAPDYVRRSVYHLQTKDIHCVGGPIETVATTPIGQTIAAAMSISFGVGNSAHRVLKGQSRLVDTVLFPAFTRAAIELAGFFDEELVRNQDDEYSYRLRKRGGKILLAVDLHARYYSRDNLLLLSKQFYQYGFWKVRVLQKHPRQMSLRQFIPPLFVLAIMGGGLLVLLHPLIKWLWVGMLGVYLLADLLASLVTAFRLRPPVPLLLPLIFPIIHLAYGLGFVMGLGRFINRWRERA